VKIEIVEIKGVVFLSRVDRAGKGRATGWGRAGASGRERGNRRSRGGDERHSERGGSLHSGNMTKIDLMRCKWELLDFFCSSEGLAPL